MRTPEQAALDIMEELERQDLIKGSYDAVREILIDQLDYFHKEYTHWLTTEILVKEHQLPEELS